MVQDNFVTYEQAISLRELGFDWKCFGFYLYDNELNFGGPRDYNFIVGNDHISAPTLSQTQKWFREVKGIDVHYSYGRKKWTYYWGRRWSHHGEDFDTPIEALYAGIDRVIKYLKENDQ